VLAVDGASFRLNEGETLGIVGETGCGKSTLARSILGLVRPPGEVDAQCIRYRNRELSGISRREWRQLRGSEIGFIPQNPFGALSPVMRISDQFHHVLKAHGNLSRQARWQEAATMLDRVGIHEPERVLRGYVHELSGGMAQRTVISMALILSPRLIVADEPTTGLDVSVQKQILELVVDLKQNTGSSMILVSHDLGVVAQYCDKVAVMYAGRIIEIGTVFDVLKRSAHPYTIALLAAVPKPGSELQSLSGTVPDLREPLLGCAFYERCPYRMDPRCENERPEMRLVGDSHWVATFCDVSHFRKESAKG
jgi:peptide/nickel transport system ATP-binding protein